MIPSLWTIVLAAGAGRRLAAVTGGVPKQFWAPRGTRSLLEQTTARVARLTPSHQIVTIVDRSHRAFIEALPGSAWLGQVLAQPADRGTAIGVLLGLQAIVTQARHAVVLLTPADHGVADSRVYRAGIRASLEWVQAGQADVVLLGAEPSSPAGDFGWIMPRTPRGSASAERFRDVVAFVEKPSTSRAAMLLRAGGIWNTMVAVARVDALLDLYRRHLPGLIDLLGGPTGLPSSGREAFLVEAYRDLDTADFSHDLLTSAEGLVTYTWPAAMGWTDLGTPERLHAWLAVRAEAALPRTSSLRPELAAAVQVA